MKKLSVSILITNFNGLKDTLECLDSIDKQSYPHIETIIVDNNSSDDSVKKIKEKFPKVKLIENSVNAGFAEGNNIAYKNSTGDYIFLLNNDAFIGTDTVQKMVEYMEKNAEVGIIQNKVLIAEKPELTDSAGSYFTSTGFLIHEGIGQKDFRKEPKQVFSVIGASLFTRREVIEKVGLFDSDYFIFFEETDFCWRAQLAGYKVQYAPFGITHHHKGRTMKKSSNQRFIQYHAFKNRLNSILKNLSFGRLLFTLPCHLFIMTGFVFIYLLTLKPAISFSIIKAIAWNILNLPATLRKRKHIQKNIRKLKDKEVFKNTSAPINLRWAINFAVSYFKS